MNTGMENSLTMEKSLRITSSLQFPHACLSLAAWVCLQSGPGSLKLPGFLYRFNSRRCRDAGKEERSRMAFSLQTLFVKHLFSLTD